MIKGYRSLRLYCHEHEWAAGFSAAVLLTLLASLVFLSLAYQASIWQWLSSNILLNGLLLIGIILLTSGFSVSLLSLSFCPCSDKERAEKAVYRDQPILADALKGIKNLGVNPKRQHMPARNAS